MKKSLVLIIIICAFAILFPSGKVYAAKNSNACKDKAKSMFGVNDIGTNNVYNKIDDVSPGTTLNDAGVEWACNGGNSRGVTWITNEAGFSKSGNKYTINVNAFMKRDGETTMGVVGAVSGKTNTDENTDATNVHICNSDLSKCDEDIGISYVSGSGWTNSSSNSASTSWPARVRRLGYNFRRASKANYVSNINDWTYPEGVAKIKINGPTLISAVGGVTEKTGHGEITLKLFRGYNDGAISYGVSNFKILVEQESTSELQNNTRARVTVKGVAQEEKSGYATTNVTKEYTVNQKSTDIEFDNRLKAKVTKGKQHTATVTWTGEGVTSGASSSISITPSSSSWTYNPSNEWNGAFNYKKTTVSLDPGKNDEKCSGVTTPSKYSTSSGQGGSTSSKICIKLNRPYAYFTGSVTAAVKKNSARTDVAIPASHEILLGDSDDGYYEIQFTSTVTRKSWPDDDAGETVKTQYSASRREASTGGVSTATWSNSPSATVGVVDTRALLQGEHQDVFNPKVSGTLKYGESRTFCSSMTYRNKQLTTNALVNATGSEYCVKITRPKAKCAIGTSFEYGIKDGTNVGAIGVRNFNNTALNKFSWTTASNESDKRPSYGDTNTWAMPGDNIQFKYGACAGAYYAIEFSGLTGKGTHYSTAGWLTNNTRGLDGSTLGGDSRYFGTNSNGYLFKSEALGNILGYQNPVNKDNANLAAITATTASPYASWTTGFNGASKPARGFLSRPSNSDPVAEMYGDSDSGLRAKSAASPSVNTYNGDPTRNSNAYRICKTDNDSDNHRNCLLNKREVGNTIYQQLSWNYLSIGNAAVTRGPEVHTATAFVRVPYNYYLEPYVENEDSSGVVYLGESKIMYPGVVVYPRKNSLVHGGATYATVTKETHIVVSVYNSKDTRREHALEEEITQRLNRDGTITTEAKEDTSFMSGGMKFDIVDDGYNEVGDKICTEITIWPVDSHETGSKSDVYGASKDSRNISWDQQYALYEGYRINPDGTPVNTKTATSCSTIAKRPTMSVESSNAYSATTSNNKPGFTTGVYAKNTNGGKYIFGSWSEYGVFGRVNLSDGKTFVSGAAIGYGTNANNTVRNAARSNNAAQVVATGNTRVKTCSFMTQTFVNLVDGNCQTSSKVIGTDSMVSYRDNILERYGSMGEDKKVTAMMGRGDSRINLDISADDIEKYRVEGGNDDSVVALYAATNDAVLSATPKFAPNSEDYHPNRTIIYNVKGTLTIKGNINDERLDSKSMLGDMTGVIIIAKKVWIDADVDYINATIVTRDDNDAEINTCKYDRNETIKIGTGNGDGQRGSLDSTKCDKTLVFDGPVFTRKLILNRTAGADKLTGSIKRAEIFNLNMANYLWSFDQMTHYSQAVTTYSRELPTRY